jgi:hypothetical protein
MNIMKLFVFTTILLVFVSAAITQNTGRLSRRIIGENAAAVEESILFQEAFCLNYKAFY